MLSVSDVHKTLAAAPTSSQVYDHILIRLQRRYGRGKKQLPAADRGGKRDATPTFVPVVGRSVGLQLQRGVSEHRRTKRARDRPFRRRDGPARLRTARTADSKGPPGAAR